MLILRPTNSGLKRLIYIQKCRSNTKLDHCALCSREKIENIRKQCFFKEFIDLLKWLNQNLDSCFQYSQILFANFKIKVCHLAQSN